MLSDAVGLFSTKEKAIAAIKPDLFEDGAYVAIYSMNVDDLEKQQVSFVTGLSFYDMNGNQLEDQPLD